MLDGLRTENNERVRDAGAYICKYITKDGVAELGQKCFITSQGLHRPKETKLYKVYAEDVVGNVRYDIEMEKELREWLEKNMAVTYENSREIAYPMSNGQMFVNECKYQQGTLKNDFLWDIMTTDFSEISGDEDAIQEDVLGNEANIQGHSATDGVDGSIPIIQARFTGI